MRLDQAIATHELEAKSPPGWKHTVEHMKDHPEIDNPFALAWYMKNKGDKSHIKSAEAQAKAGTGELDAYMTFDAKKKKVRASRPGLPDPRMVQAAEKIQTLTQQSVDKAVVPTHGDKNIVKDSGKTTSHSMNWRKKSEVPTDSFAVQAKEGRRMKAEPYNAEPNKFVVKAEDKLTTGFASGNLAQTLAAMTLVATAKVEIDSIAAGGPGSGRHPGYPANSTPAERIAIDRAYRKSQGGEKDMLTGKPVTKSTSAEPSLLTGRPLNAGGPGSGRKPGFKYGPNAATHMADRHNDMEEFHDSKTKSEFGSHADASHQHGEASEHFVDAAEHYAKGNNEEGDAAMNRGYTAGKGAYDATKEVGGSQQPAMQRMSRYYGK